MGERWFRLPLHFLDGFMVAFPVLVFFLFGIGNPERRFFRMGAIALSACISLGLLSFEGILSFDGKNLPGAVAGTIQFLGEWDGLLMIILFVASMFLFWIDGKKSHLK